VAAEADELVHRLGPPLEHHFDRSVRAVDRAAGQPALLRRPPDEGPEADSLDDSVDDDAAPGEHGPYASSVRLVEELTAARIGATHNQYARSPLRRERLAAYLEARRGARLLLVGEAAGYRGARVSGIPFTSERQLTGTGPAEATATIVHRVLAELGLEHDVLLWNLVPTHPHRPGNPASNRPPTRDEIRAAGPFLDALAGGRQVVAIGRLAQRTLGGPYVRHPSHGGAPAFRRSLLHFCAGGPASVDPLL